MSSAPYQHLVVLLAALGLSGAAHARSGRVGAWPDDTAGPEVSSYGSLQTLVDDEPVPMPLQHTEVTAHVAGFVASVEVEQRFGNPFARPIEAVYVFPLPHGAAVHAFSMEVGRRTIRGEVRRRAEARELYEQAREEGRTAALLDQERDNVFTQQVANILPGDDIRVRIRYVETLSYDRGAYEYVFPMVVGPRYVGGGRAVGRSGAGWAPDTDRIPDASRVTPPLLAKGRRPGHDIMVTVHLDAGLPLRNLYNPTHRIRIRREAPHRATVKLVTDDTLPNRDFILRYEIDGPRPEAALLAHRDERGGTFLMMVQPEAQVPDQRLAPREVVFVVDTSGSMDGFPLDKAKDVVRTCLKNLGPDDRFQLVRFAGSAEALFEQSVPPRPAYVEQALEALSAWYGGGGTEFLPALDLALRPSRDPDRARAVLFLTDGYIGYEAEVVRHVRQHLGDANLFALGVGSAVNRYLIDAMSRAGMAQPFYILNAESADPVVQRFSEYVSRPSLTNVEIDWGGLDVHDVTPGRLPDLFAERPLFVVGRYERGGAATVTLRGRLAGEPWEERLEVSLPGGGLDEGHGAIAHLWARRRIADLMDRWHLDPDGDKAAEEAVTDLALRFSLMSRFTSFVAVDDAVRNPDGAPTAVAVPVPLPEDVSARAAPRGAYLQARAGAARSSGGYGGLGLMGRGRGGGGPGMMRALSLGSGATARSAGPKLAAKRVRALARVGNASVMGSLDGDVIRRVFRRRQASIRAVYEKALKRNAKLAGKLVVRVVIGADGRVAKAEIAEDTVGDDDLAQALLAVVRRFRFPKPPGGGTVEVRYPFIFSPGP